MEIENEISSMLLTEDRVNRFNQSLLEELEENKEE